MNNGIGTRNGMAGIVFFFLLLFSALAVGGLFATETHAYPTYADGCKNSACHGSFTGSTSPKGTNFSPASNKHDMHRTTMGTACGLCHVVTGDNPSMNTSAGAGGVAGRGCTGCHNGAGLRAHHQVNGVTVCSGCHAPTTPPAESVQPPYYGTSATKANNACNPVATALLNENWTNDFLGLDNDGDNLYDMNDPDCAAPAANQPPVLSAIGNKTVNESSLLSFTAAATDPDAGQTRTFSLDAGAPAGAAITAGGAFTWTPTEAQGPGSYTITVRVTDNGSPALNDFETITVTVSEVNVAPVLGSIGPKSGTVGSPVTFTATATDADVPAQARAFSLGTGAPAGATINSSTGAFSWTPAQAGTFPVTVIVADNGTPSMNDTEAITVTVTEAVGALTGISISGDATVNESTATAKYTATATWSDGTIQTGVPAAWSVSPSTYATINPSTGVLTAGAVTADQTVIVSASYTSGNVTKTASATVKIVDVPAALSISTATLPAGTVGTAYSQALTATGGTAPYSWTVSAGTLPAGLNLSTGGVISGTPTAAGTSSFTVQVTGGGTATKAFSVTINPAPVAGGVTVMPADGAVDVPVNTVVSGTLTGTGDIASAFNATTFTLKVKGSSTATISVSSPDDRCVDDGIVKGAISYNESNTAGTFTPTCLLTNGTVYTATIASSTGGLSAAKTWEFTTIVASPDTDDDGVPDNEDDHPGNKGKGTPPSSRGHGKFLIDVTDTAGASLAVTKGMAETDASLNQAGIPAGYEFPDGLVSYQVIGVAPGGTATVKITFPSGIPAGSKVYKVGPAGFQEFGGATIQGSTVTLTLTDGGAGDSDGQVNGIIVDPVGVAVPVATGTGSIDLASGSGGGCSVAGRTGSGGSNIDMAMILAGLGLSVWGIRIRRRRE